MKKILLLFMAIFSMAISASAKDYVGDVTNVYMKGNKKGDAQNITFSVNGNLLTADFDVPGVFPPHHIYFTSNISTTGSFPASGKVKVFGVPVKFEGTVTVTKFSDAENILIFHFSCADPNVSFDFTSPSNATKMSPKSK